MRHLDRVSKISFTVNIFDQVHVEYFQDAKFIRLFAATSTEMLKCFIHYFNRIANGIKQRRTRTKKNRESKEWKGEVSEAKKRGISRNERIERIEKRENLEIGESRSEKEVSRNRSEIRN